jgi:hypothetical protein
MYVKLVAGAAQINVQGAMRDIGRMITAATPSLSLLGAFSSSSSVLVDATPAGWTYVGSNNAADQPTIAGTAAGVLSSNQVNYCFSAPMLNNASQFKYAVLTNNSTLAAYTLANTGFNLTGASSATALGVVTNEGPRYYTTGSTASYMNTMGSSFIPVAAGTVLHLIANPQHITIVIENTGMAAVWETTSTDAHTFYNIPAFVQYSHYASSKYTQANITIPTAYNSTSTTLSTTWSAAVFNVTNPNNGTNYGTYDPTSTNNLNINSLANSLTGCRVNTASATGVPQYAINPVYFTLSQIGYPTQFVTGPVPVYYVAGTLGNTGDTVTVNADVYYFFNAGTGFGLLMKTS